MAEVIQVPQANVFVRTFGTVYVADKTNVPVTNYMKPQDVAWDKIVRFCDGAASKVIMLGEENQSYRSYVPFGNRSQWRAHRNYHELQRERIIIDCLSFQLTKIANSSKDPVQKRQSLSIMVLNYPNIKNLPEVLELYREFMKENSSNASGT